MRQEVPFDEFPAVTSASPCARVAWQQRVCAGPDAPDYGNVLITIDPSWIVRSRSQADFSYSYTFSYS